MVEKLLPLSRSFLKTHNQPYRRYLLARQPFKHRFTILLGQRGVGKTTLLVQYLHELFDDALSTERALYLPADHFLVGEASLYEIAEEFHHLGGSVLCIDEIHKYGSWSRELKSIYDSFPSLKVIASGSSALIIRRGTHDLSRRAPVVYLLGVSLREFLELTLDISLPAYTLDTIRTQHERCAEEVIAAVEERGEKILALFSLYLVQGYYPYSLETPDTQLYHLLVEQSIHASIENDLLAVHPSLTGASIKRLKKLLSLLASSVPFVPDLRKLKTALGIGDERTLKLYLDYLEEAGAIAQVGKAGGKTRAMAKPAKLYLNNPNQLPALLGSPATVNTGTLRETFFLNMVSSAHEVAVPTRGDFLVDNTLTFEIGGKSKDFGQLQNVPDSYLALDRIERGQGRRVPLWLFGFLY
ncbi:MAG: AAA family ATPase [Chitinivibrionales bacterium]|nr:AAA family ATPase [Chitinivibrionales bacterium]